MSPESGFADLDLPIGGITHRMKLPIGTYWSELIGGDEPCNVTVEIKGKMYKPTMYLLPVCVAVTW